MEKRGYFRRGKTSKRLELLKDADSLEYPQGIKAASILGEQEPNLQPDDNLITLKDGQTKPPYHTPQLLAASGQSIGKNQDQETRMKMI